jgi:cystathionine beta-lyase family protein involved in aluminum resistance
MKMKNFSLKKRKEIIKPSIRNSNLLQRQRNIELNLTNTTDKKALMETVIKKTHLIRVERLQGLKNNPKIEVVGRKAD